jgi:hypothetical protein
MTDSAKIQLLLDREHIREAVYVYPVSIDTHDWRRFRSIFTDEIEVLLTMATNPNRTHQRVNADQFTKMVSNVIESFSMTQHFLNDYRIEVNGDDAKCFCYMYARHMPPKDKPAQAIWDLGGYYEFNLNRSGDGWKVPKYTLIGTWETNRPKDLKIDL